MEECRCPNALAADSRWEYKESGRATRMMAPGQPVMSGETRPLPKEKYNEI
jgi:hypothetical protein